MKITLNKINSFKVALLKHHFSVKNIILIIFYNEHKIVSSTFCDFAVLSIDQKSTFLDPYFRRAAKTLSA